MCKEELKHVDVIGLLITFSTTFGDIICMSFYFVEVADITHALSKLTEPAPVPIHKLSVSNMVYTAKKKIRKHRGEESPLNNDVLNTILLVSSYLAFMCVCINMCSLYIHLFLYGKHWIGSIKCKSFTFRDYH